MKNFLKLLAFIALISWSGYTLYPILTGKALSSAGGISDRMEAHPANAKHALSILFIGNSYTFFNDMPRQLIEIAKSDPANTIHFTVQSATQGGIGLEELWDNKEIHKLLKAHKWDYVVLQQQSFWAMFPNSAVSTLKVARAWDKEIKQAGARTLLFTTWARKPGTDWYTDSKYSFLRSPEYMQRKFNEETRDLGIKIGAVAIPAGGYWAYVNSAFPEINLYTRDGTHPGPAGSYLNALVFYHYFTQQPVTGVTYAPPYTSAETAKKLREIIR